MLNKISIFPITVFKTKVSENDSLKTLLCPKILKNSDYLTIPQDWTTNKIKTSFDGEPKGLELLSQNSTNFNLLVQKYTECMCEIFKKDFKISIPRIWYNVYTDGEYQEEHDHLTGPFTVPHFSCIHFLSFDPNQHKAPEFRDPLSQLRNLSIELECGEVYVPQIREGDLLIFPSYLRHWVPPSSKTDYPRITLSFNLKVLEYDD